jgi:glycosyltransferase involved in cell wall biosynthesis
MALELGIGERVRFLGFREDAAALVAAFDVFVSSSRTEGLPLGTLEAVGLGTPVVLTRVGGVPEIVDSGRTGLLVPPGDPAALAEGIMSVLDDPERASEMARAGAEDVRRRFGVQRMCREYESLYGRLLRS